MAANQRPLLFHTPPPLPFPRLPLCFQCLLAILVLAGCPSRLWRKRAIYINQPSTPVDRGHKTSYFTVQERQGRTDVRVEYRYHTLDQLNRAPMDYSTIAHYKYGTTQQSCSPWESTHLPTKQQCQRMQVIPRLRGGGGRRGRDRIKKSSRQK